MGAAVGRLNMLSIVGRRAAPKGVDRKSEGKSRFKKTLSYDARFCFVREHTLDP
jgi:hypothetical protein